MKSLGALFAVSGCTCSMLIQRTFVGRSSFMIISPREPLKKDPRYCNSYCETLIKWFGIKEQTFIYNVDLFIDTSHTFHPIPLHISIGSSHLLLS